MLDIKYIRNHPEEIKQNCERRRIKLDIDELLRLDASRRDLQSDLDEVRGQLNQASKTKPSPEEIQRLRTLGGEIKRMESELAAAEARYLDLLKSVPNLTHPDAPTGGEEDFTVVSTHGQEPNFDFQPKTHEMILGGLGLVDFERGAKVAESKFYFTSGDLVRLNLALIQYGIDTVTAHGYRLVETPDVAKNGILEGIGFNPRGPETQVYSIEGTDLSLVGTAEITMGGYHADEILDLSQGPKKYVALSHCFRTEAGAYGKTNAGLYRVHQFTKLEMFVYCRPEESEAMHQEILSIEKEICDGLGLHYRVIDTASADLGAPAYRKFDIEAWMTMKGGDGKAGDFGEITSTSNCTDYQARRLGIRYRTPDGKNEFVHTLNGTAVVLSRFPLAIVEQYQQMDGSVKVPAALVKYMGKEVIK